MHRISATFAVTFFLTLLINSCYGQQNTQQSRALSEYLLDPSRYNRDVIPICGNQSHLTVKIGLAVRDIVELIEVQQIIRLKIWMRLRWKDCVLKWDPSKFDNITNIVIPYEKIWIPDITLFESVCDEANMPDMDRYRAYVTSDGEVSYNFATIITTVCRVVVTYFPFDSQVCILTFGSWVYTGKQIDLEAAGDSADIDNFQLHNEWSLESTKLKKRVAYYLCCSDPFPDIIVHIYLKRKPTFYVVTIIFPCFVITSLTFMGFVLPPISGEKISLQMTVLLSLTVFLFLVQDKLPSDSDHFPYLAIYFAFSMLLVCLSSIMSGIVMHVHYKSPERYKMHPILRSLFLDKLRKLVCVSSVKTTCTSQVIIKQGRFMHAVKSIEKHLLRHNSQSKARHSDSNNTIKSDDHVISSNGNIAKESHGNIPVDVEDIEFKDQEDICEDPNEWELLAFILDRLFMGIYVLLNGITAITFFSVMLSKHGNEIDE